MSTCNPALTDLLDGTKNFASMTPEEMCNAWRCLGGEDNKNLLATLFMSQIAAAGGGAGGEAVFSSGVGTPIPAGAHSVLIVKTNGPGTVTVEGQVLTALDSSLAFEAPPGKTLPTIVVTDAATGTHAWTALT